MKTIIHGGTIVNEGKSFVDDVFVVDDEISSIGQGETADCIIDATGCFVLPGIIDDHVHFREPGLTDKADM